MPYIYVFIYTKILVLCSLVTYWVRPESISMERKRKREESKGMEDRITALPYDLLSTIVHLLPVKEAAASAILSKRWKHIWKSTPNLDFVDDRYHRFLQIRHRVNNHPNGERNLNLVNGAIEQHTNPTIKRFRVCFVIDPRFTEDIVNWIQFAVSKKVEILELEFYTDTGPTGFQHPLYPFPKKLLSHHSCGYDIAFKFLKVLHLRRVDVTGEVLEYLLYNCAALERLTVNAALNLVDVRVVGPSISLKHLAFIDCSSLKRIEVCDVKLVSFHISGLEVESMSLTNVPSLVEVFYMTSKEMWNYGFVELLFTNLSSCISQLEILSLDISDWYSWRYNPKYEFPILSNLRHLELKLNLHSELGIPNLQRFIEASPYLHRLVLKLLACPCMICESLCRKEVRISGLYRDYLKIVEIVDYHGSHCHDQLALSLVMTAAALEKLVVYPVRRSAKDFGVFEDVRDHANRHLRSKVPKSVEFVCLLQS